MSRWSESANPSGASLLVLALLMGLAAGIFAAADSVGEWATAGPFHPSLEKLPPLVLSLFFIGVPTLALLALTRGALFWRHRFLLCVVAIMFSSHMMGVGRGPANPLALSIVLMFGFWLLERLTILDAPVPPRGFVGLILIFTFWMFASILGTASSGVILGVLVNLPKLLLAIMLVDLVGTRVSARAALTLLFWSAGLVALVGIAQSVMYYGFGVEFSLAEENYRYAHTPFGKILRATGFSRFANQFAPPLVVAGLLSAYLATDGKCGWRRMSTLPVVIFCVLGVALSMARGAWVAFVLGLLILPYFRWPHGRRRWSGVLLLLLMIGVGSGLIQAGLTKMHNLSEGGLVERGILMEAGIEAMIDHPWNGVGINNFGPYSPTFERHPVHNAFLQVGVELGIPALLSYLGLFLWVGVRLITAMRSTADPAIRAEYKALFLGLLGLFIVIQGEPMGYSQFVWIYVAVVEAALRSRGSQGVDRGGFHAA